MIPVINWLAYHARLWPWFFSWRRVAWVPADSLPAGEHRIRVCCFDVCRTYNSQTAYIFRLVVWHMNFMTFQILGIMIPTDSHIFQRGRSTKGVSAQTAPRPSSTLSGRLYVPRAIAFLCYRNRPSGLGSTCNSKPCLQVCHTHCHWLDWLWPSSCCSFGYFQFNSTQFNFVGLHPDLHCGLLELLLGIDFSANNFQLQLCYICQ